VALITKTDLVSSDAVRRLVDRLERLNPGLPIHYVQHGEIDPALLFDVGTRAIERIAAGGIDAPAHDHDHGDDHAHDPDVNRHGDIRAYTIQSAAPLAWERLRLWLETVFSLRGAAFLRLKGIVQVAGEDRPVVLQAVGNCFSPPYALARWPDGARGSRIVLITQGLAAADLQRSFDVFVIHGIGDDAAR